MQIWVGQGNALPYHNLRASSSYNTQIPVPPQVRTTTESTSMDTDDIALPANAEKKSSQKEII